MPLKILHVAGDFPFPSTHGARVDVWGRMRVLADLGHSIDFVATVRRKPDVEAMQAVSRVAKAVTLAQRGPNIGGVLGHAPVQVQTRRSLAFLPFQEDYDITLLEGDFVSPILDNRSLRSKHFVMRVHNQEAEFFRECASTEKRLLARAYYSVESSRCEAYASKIYPKMDQLWFISKDFHSQWQKQYGANATACWLPPSTEIRQQSSVSRSSRKVMFAGNLTAPTNLDGLLWYWRLVHPALKRIPGYQLLIAGSSPTGRIPKALRPMAEDAFCRFVLNAASLDAEYARSAVFANPMQRGASLKLKTVNAVEHGMPVVTTSIGNEGTGFLDQEHVLIRNDAAGFASAVSHLLFNPLAGLDMTGRAQRYLTDFYDPAATIPGLLEKLTR